MSAGSVAVHIATQAQGDIHDSRFARDLAAYLRPVTNFSVIDLINTDTHFARRRSEELFKEPEWKLFTAEQKVAITATATDTPFPFWKLGHAHAC